MVYNPFTKKIAELTVEDLKKLFDVQAVEGYYVQYTTEFPSSEKIGQSVASFANTYGGWVFIGISAEKHVARDICGFSLKAISDPIGMVEEILNNDVDPVPIYHPQLIMLDQDRAVLVIFIPENQEMPFISKDGRIYRRTHDSSEPVPEINRYTIDRLFDTGREVTKKFKQFRTDESSFPRNCMGQGTVKVFLSPYPLGLIDKPDLVSMDSLDKHLLQSKEKVQIPFSGSKVMVSGYLPFHYGQVTHESILLRQADPTTEDGNSLTAELFIDGKARFYIPLHYLSALSKWNLNQIESVQAKATLSKLLTKKDPNPIPLQFFDIGFLWLTIASLLSYYQEWLGTDTLLTDLLFFIDIDGVPRSVPFFDSGEWGNYVQKFGLPIINNQTIQIPSDTGRGGGSRIKLSNEWPLWLEISYFLSLAFGLPPELYSNTLLKALERAVSSDITLDSDLLKNIHE